MPVSSRRLFPALLVAAALASASCSGGQAATPRVLGTPAATPSARGSVSAPALSGSPAASPTAATPATSAASPTAPTPVAAPPSPPPYSAPAARWTACNGSFECGKLTVPVDYAQPGGATLQLALIRLRATDRAHRIGSLVVNPGGPGGSGVDYVRDGSDVFSPALRARFDLVGFDPRGVGASRGIRCESDRALDEFFHDDPVPVSPAVRRIYDEDSRAFAAACNRSSSALLAHVGTVEVARDLDVLRAALGDAKLSYFGYSYGTYLGATYAELFPTRLRAAVLDGAVDPSLDLVGFVQGQAKAFEAALNRWFAWCTAANGCDLAPKGGRTSQQRFDAIAAAVRAKPLSVGGGRTLGPGEFSYGVGYAMYARSLWPSLGSALAAAEKGDAGQLEDLSDSYTDRDPSGHYSDSTDANYAVNCLDHAGPRTEQGWYDAAEAVAAAAPRLGPAIVYNTLPCAYWPVPARPALPIDAAGAPPIVVVGTTHDPATPYPWAQSLARQLRSGVLVTRDGDGHTAYGPGSCVVAPIDRYLLTLVPPARGFRC